MYELMYVINPVLSDDQTKNMVERVQNYLRENDADVVHTEEMGSQRLAYPIQQQRNARKPRKTRSAGKRTTRRAQQRRTTKRQRNNNNAGAAIGGFIAGAAAGAVRCKVARC